VVTLVDDDEPSGALGQSAAADLLMGAESEADTDLGRGTFPLPQQRGRNEAGSRRSVQDGSDGQRDECLAAPDRIGQDRSTVVA
jgi:hypothetical protein